MPKIQLICEECGTTYERWPSQVEGSRFHNRQCLDRWMDREVRPKHKAPWLKELNAKPAHQKRAARASARRRKQKTNRYHRKKGRANHRRVAEQVIGRALTPDEIVHHVDENKGNDDPGNLDIAITRRQHQHTHAWLRRNDEDQEKLVLRRRKGRIKGLKYKFKTKPFKHQVKALKKLIFRRGGALFCEMGTGKTKIALDFCAAMHLKRGVDRVVIACPKSVTSVWKLEIKKHVPDHIRGKIKWIIINYEQLADREVKDTIYLGRMHVLKRWLGLGTSILIADESHLMKTPNAEKSKAMYRMGKEASYRLILTGTPLTKNPLDLYQQFKFLDDTIFGTNFNHFKKQFAVFGGYGGYKLLRYINLDRLKKRAKPWVYQVKKKDCLDLPSRTDEIVPVKLTGRSKTLYDRMNKDGLIEVGGEEIEAELMLTRILRLQQISSGFVKNKGGEIHKLGTDKAKKLDQMLGDMKSQNEDHKVVIFCEFIHDLKQAARIARKNGYRILLFHGDTTNNEREQRLCDFDEAEDSVAFITQTAAGSMGISLTAASEAIHFSHTRQYARLDQAKGRLHRIGQHHPVTHYHLITPGVDQAIWIANKTKKDVADLVLTKPHLLMQEGYQLIP